MDIIPMSEVREGDTIEINDRPALVTKISHGAFTLASVLIGTLTYGFDQDHNSEVLLLARA